ncbi:CheR family methyltransferase [Marinobacterium arenosum]|uniref:CheR family methyltransferase n=1 Tax=Marinobacterium arenosum TaxID=2862496 RepID=UPI001C959E26|nr:protein-glutamate O-methyltransferase CheR [Marinobacterium arenosum]MBY4675917.1 protein-glutamate O-methyltransferase CheR [Marinobacterium arenosum]
MSSGLSSPLSIDRNDFALFSRFLEDSCGIVLSENKQYLVQSRLGKILQEQQVSSLSDLVSRLSRPGGSRLKEQVIDAMTTNETLWFRDSHPYDLLKARVLPELVENNAVGKLRIWSAACSTGQEPYSLSMILSEFKEQNRSAFGLGEEIVATDISTHVLAQAKAGVYEMLALGRGLSPERKNRFFHERPDGSWEVQSAIKSKVRFQHFNLLGPYGSLGRFDIIFCRNVLIYFSTERKLEILRKMHGVLRKGGYLFLGASESLSGLSDLYEMVHCRPGIMYRAI